MDNQKPLEFNGTAGGYFVVFLLSLVLAYIPFFGWAFLMNYVSEWVASNSKVNGRQVIYKAGFGETLKFIFINSLLTFITFGIYTFWFMPKAYRYFTDHVSYLDGGVGMAAPAPAFAGAPADPTAPVAAVSPSPEVTPPTNPTPPTGSNPVQ